MEAQKRREYEAWFQNQQREALEYSSTVQYRESIETKANTTYQNTTSSTLETRVSIERCLIDLNDPISQVNSHQEDVSNHCDEVDESMMRLGSLSVSQQDPYKLDGRI